MEVKSPTGETVIEIVESVQACQYCYAVDCDGSCPENQRFWAETNGLVEYPDQ